MAEYETLIYEEADGVAWITMNRPDVHNAFNHQMQRDLKAAWRSLRHNDDIRCVVLTGAGEKAFCTGIDRTEVMGGWDGDPKHWTPAVPDGERSDSQFHFDDPGENIGPKANDLWKPVIAAVNGMACGGAFYMLGEVDFVIAADHATFFDPHTTFGMAAVFESMHMLQSCRSTSSCGSRSSARANASRRAARLHAGLGDRARAGGRAPRRRRPRREDDRSRAGRRDRGHGARHLGRERHEPA